MGGSGKTTSSEKHKTDAVIQAEMNTNLQKLNSNSIINSLKLDTTSIASIAGFIAFASVMFGYYKQRKPNPIPYKIMTAYQMNKPFILAGTILTLSMSAFIYLLYSIAMRSIFYTNNKCNPAGSYDYDVLPCNRFIDKTISDKKNPEPFQNAKIYGFANEMYNGLAMFKDIPESILKVVYEIYSIIFRRIEYGLGKNI